MTVDLTALETAGTIASALLTLMVLSYLFGDNFLFRIAVHLFVGVAAGYAGALALRTVLYPRLVLPVLNDGFSAVTVIFVVSWILVVLLAFKAWPATASMGSLPMALLVGVGAALVVGGAITGTLVPLALATMDSLDPAAVAPLTGETGFERVANVLILLIGTISTLVYFRFTAAPAPLRAVAVGSATRGASLLDVGDGRYRLGARGRASSTAGPPLFDVSEGVRNALDQVRAITGRRLGGESEGRLLPG